MQRAQVNVRNGRVLLLNISAREDAPSDPVDVLLPDDGRAQSGELESPINSKTAGKSWDVIAVVCAAIQQLYAPQSVLENQKVTLTRYPLGSSHIVPLLADNSALAMPLASWKALKPN